MKFGSVQEDDPWAAEPDVDEAAFGDPRDPFTVLLDPNDRALHPELLTPGELATEVSTLSYLRRYVL